MKSTSLILLSACTVSLLIGSAVLYNVSRHETQHLVPNHKVDRKVPLTKSNIQTGNRRVPMSKEWNLKYPSVNMTNFPQIDDLSEEECQSMIDDVVVAPAYSMPLTALASFPRSGNSWTRSLIQVATRYSTGSIYWFREKKEERVQKWFKAGTEDFNLRKGVCVKSHLFAADHISMFKGGAILLIRNPHYSVVSEYFRFFAGVKNFTQSELKTSMEKSNEHWTNVLLPQFRRWKNLNINWLMNCKRLLVVFFEELEKNPAHEITRMVTFLGQPILPRRIMCAVRNFQPMEKHRSQMTFDPYTPEMHDLLNSYIEQVNITLILKGGKPLPSYENYVKPSV
ncbi:sialate:O-sulfotransferase 1-like [Apostichopus japonicus]|uniref:sialate:O-sulfotransferase 1-like n=1 Tax=Stichopus japonicus TaxID=307972 RepID=UPI003AB8E580